MKNKICKKLHYESSLILGERSEEYIVAIKLWASLILILYILSLI